MAKETSYGICIFLWEIIFKGGGACAAAAVDWKPWKSKKKLIKARIYLQLIWSMIHMNFFSSFVEPVQKRFFKLREKYNNFGTQMKCASVFINSNTQSGGMTK